MRRSSGASVGRVGAPARASSPAPADPRRPHPHPHRPRGPREAAPHRQPFLTLGRALGPGAALEFEGGWRRGLLGGSGPRWGAAKERGAQRSVRAAGPAARRPRSASSNPPPLACAGGAAMAKSSLAGADGALTWVVSECGAGGRAHCSRAAGDAGGG